MGNSLCTVGRQCNIPTGTMYKEGGHSEIMNFEFDSLALPVVFYLGKTLRLSEPQFSLLLNSTFG